MVHSGVGEVTRSTARKRMHTRQKRTRIVASDRTWVHSAISSSSRNVEDAADWLTVSSGATVSASLMTAVPFALPPRPSPASNWIVTRALFAVCPNVLWPVGDDELSRWPRLHISLSTPPPAFASLGRQTRPLVLLNWLTVSSNAR